MPFDYTAFDAELTALGEEEVRARYRRDEYLSHNIKNRYVQDWLRRFDDSRISSRMELTEARAFRAEIIAAIAAIAAIIAAVAAVIDVSNP